MKNDHDNSIVAYFTLEIALESDIKTYAGGLGVLAGDVLRSAADNNFSMVAVSLLSSRGYIRQRITNTGDQASIADPGYNFSKLKKLPIQIDISFGKDKIKVNVWQYIIKGRNNFQCPVYFLDSDISSNPASARSLTKELYGGDDNYRLEQGIILARAGVKLLEMLGYKEIKKFHLNESRCSLVALELWQNLSGLSAKKRLQTIKDLCVFNAHTPIEPLGKGFAVSSLNRYYPNFVKEFSELIRNKQIDLNLLGFYLSGHVIVVSRAQKEMMSQNFPKQKIEFVTNGVNSSFWTVKEFQSLYDKYIPGWREKTSLLAKAENIPLAKIKQAHQKAKKRLIKAINEITPISGQKAEFEENVFTLCFARRFAVYKRPEFILADIKRLLAINDKVGKIQLIFAGKAHPEDKEGKMILKRVWQTGKRLAGRLEVIFLEDYDLDKAKLLASGVDLWVNTPLIGREASGTSGMKAAHNGVPQLSTFDGWWPEGYIKGKTGWVIEEDRKSGENNFYNLLEEEILPFYYNNPEKWLEIMRSTISINSSRFNTDRVLLEYIAKAYLK